MRRLHAGFLPGQSRLLQARKPCEFFFHVPADKIVKSCHIIKAMHSKLCPLVVVLADEFLDQIAYAGHYSSDFKSKYRIVVGVWLKKAVVTLGWPWLRCVSKNIIPYSDYDIGVWRKSSHNQRRITGDVSMRAWKCHVFPNEDCSEQILMGFLSALKYGSVKCVQSPMPTSQNHSDSGALISAGATAPSNPCRFIK